MANRKTIALAEAARGRFADGIGAAATSGAMLAHVAAGVLSGIADTAQRRATRSQ